MSWLSGLNLDRSRLLPGADPAEIVAAEEALGWRLPDEHRELLLLADGGEVHNFLFYSVGPGLHPAVQLVPANSGRDGEYPLLAIGRDATCDFGYRKSDLPATAAPIYFISDETWELDRAAGSLKEFLALISALKPDEGLRPRR